jgi:hypothetical protein
MPKETLMCEICREAIGTFHSDEVKEPIKGAMFHSKDPAHGFPAPFRAPAIEWEHMRCPYCQKRPFLTRGVLMTVNGFWSIPQQGYVDRPVGAEVERTEVEALLHQRYVREEASRIDVDAERLKSDIDDRLGPAPREPDPVGPEVPPPTEAIPLHYGPDGEPPGPKYADLSPEERKKEAARRIALDEAEEEKPKFEYPCPFCELGYKHSSSLNKHVKHKHGGDDANSRSANTNNDSKTGVSEGTASTEE